MPILIPNDAPLWLRDFVADIERETEEALRMPSFTVATLPAAATFERRWIYVSDEAGGGVPAFSDGTDWRRATDRAVVS